MVAKDNKDFTRSHSCDHWPTPLSSFAMSSPYAWRRSQVASIIKNKLHPFLTWVEAELKYKTKPPTE